MGFQGYLRAKEHLEAVEKNHMDRYNEPYDLWFIDKKNKIPLIRWKEEMIKRCEKKYNPRTSVTKQEKDPDQGPRSGSRIPVK
jgi:hypothetical protein